MSKSATPAPSDNRAHFRQLSVLIGVSAVDMIGFAIVLPLLPFYALNFKATPVQIGWLMAAFSIAQLLSSPLWGRFSDRYGRRPALLVGLSASALAYIVFGLADSLWMLFLSRLVQGAGGGTTGVVHAYVADTMKPSDRARALGWLSAATSAGVAIGPTLGSWFNLWLGPSGAGFRGRRASAWSTFSLPGSGCPSPSQSDRGRGPGQTQGADLAYRVDRGVPSRVARCLG